MRLAQVVSELSKTFETRFREEWEKADAIHAGLEATDKMLERNQEQIIRLLTGEKGNPLKGKKPSRGLVASVEMLTDDVDWIKSEIADKGIKVQLPAGAWAAIWVAIIAGVFQVFSALVSSL